MAYETVSFGSRKVREMAEVAATRRSRITPEREAELYAAVLDLLREVGYDALTMDAVAARTRSSKATLYRQWGGKPELVAKAIRHNKPGSIADIDTGSLRGDLHALTSREDDCTMQQNAALMRGLFMAVPPTPTSSRRSGNSSWSRRWRSSTGWCGGLSTEARSAPTARRWTTSSICSSARSRRAR